MFPKRNTFCSNCPCVDFCVPKYMMDIIPDKKHCDREFEKLPVTDDSITSSEFWLYRIYKDGNDIILSIDKDWVENVLLNRW